MDTLRSILDIPGKFLNVLLENNEEGHFNRTLEK